MSTGAYSACHKPA